MTLDRKLRSGDKTGMKKPVKHKGLSSFNAPLLLAAAVLVSFVLSGCSISIPPMDDTYIHLVYGSSLFSSSPLCFNEAEISSGFTSPLWLVPSALASIAGTAGAPIFLMVLSLLAAATALVMLHPVTGLLLVMTGPFLFHATSGMETALSCLAVAAVWRCVRDRTGIINASLILAGAFLVRPELSVLAIPLLITMENKSAVNILRLAAPSVIAGLLWVLWNVHSTGFPLPSTFYAKQPVSWLSAAASGLPGLLRGFLITSPLLFFASVTSIAGLLRSKADRQRKVSMALIPILLFAVSLYLQPNSFFQMRYYVPALTAMVLATGYWLKGLKRWKLNTLILAVSMLPGMIVFAARRAEASMDVLSIDVEPAEYLASIASPEQTVASADIGAVRWITGIRILDLDGLVTPERLPGDSIEGWKWISQRSSYLLAFPDQYSSLILEAGNSLDFLEGFSSDRNVICGEDSVALWKIR